LTPGKEAAIQLSTQPSAAIVHAETGDGHDSWSPSAARPAVAPRALTNMLHLFERFPTGLFLLTATHDGVRSGALVRWVQPCAATPPMVTVAFRRGIFTSSLIYDSRRFAVCRFPETDRLLRSTFASYHEPAEDPFLGSRTITTPNGCPVPQAALGWLECELAFNIDLEADFGLYVGLVRNAA
jgi:flavin reductase (DIM6/NTAB) family NADH-FMN oxidoreductase RutF